MLRTEKKKPRQGWRDSDNIGKDVMRKMEYIPFCTEKTKELASGNNRNLEMRNHNYPTMKQTTLQKEQPVL